MQRQCQVTLQSRKTQFHTETQTSSNQCQTVKKQINQLKTYKQRTPKQKQTKNRTRNTSIQVPEDDPNEAHFTASASPGKSSIPDIKPGDFYNEEIQGSVVSISKWSTDIVTKLFRNTT